MIDGSASFSEASGRERSARGRRGVGQLAGRYGKRSVARLTERRRDERVVEALGEAVDAGTWVTADARVSKAGQRVPALVAISPLAMII